MNIYRNKITGQILEMVSEFGSNAVWEKVSAPQKTAKAEDKAEAKKVETPKKTTTRKAVKK